MWLTIPPLRYLLSTLLLLVILNVNALLHHTFLSFPTSFSINHDGSPLGAHKLFPLFDYCVLPSDPAADFLDAFLLDPHSGDCLPLRLLILLAPASCPLLVHISLGLYTSTVRLFPIAPPAEVVLAVPVVPQIPFGRPWDIVLEVLVASRLKFPSTDLRVPSPTRLCLLCDELCISGLLFPPVLPSLDYQPLF